MPITAQFVIRLSKKEKTKPTTHTADTLGQRMTRCLIIQENIHNPTSDTLNLKHQSCHTRDNFIIMEKLYLSPKT